MSQLATHAGGLNDEARRVLSKRISDGTRATYNRYLCKFISWLNTNSPSKMSHEFTVDAPTCGVEKEMKKFILELLVKHIAPVKFEDI
jgi:hypothetical protein